MHTIKGGWVGQTFALATCGDSGGRKSRIRRSKEERKAMVESFIKKFQRLNNGNFPSLNLTHKEVGGSFYTVREIVREIIQENRVLGPAKFPTEEQNNNKLLEQFPLGSICIEPQACMSPSEETQVSSHMAPNEYQGRTEEEILNSNGQSYLPEHQRLLLDSEQVVNGNNVAAMEDLKSEGPFGTQAMPDHHQLTNAEQLLNSFEQFNQPNHQELNNEEISSVSEATEEDEGSDGPNLVSPTPIHCHEISEQGDQETKKEQVLHSGGEFHRNAHLRSDGEEADCEINQALGKANECGEPIDRRVAEDILDSAVDQTKDLAALNGRTSVKVDVIVEKFPLRPVAKTIHGFDMALNEQTNMPKSREVKVIEHDNSEPSPSMNVEDGTDLAGSTLEKISTPVEEKAVLNIGNSPLETSKLSTIEETLEAQISSLVGEKAVNATERINNENLNSLNSSVSNGHPIPDETVRSKSRLNIQHDSNIKKESSSTLDRINLETWEGASQKPAGSESNPLLALFKAFINAFVKFWTE